MSTGSLFIANQFSFYQETLLGKGLSKATRLSYFRLELRFSLRFDFLVEGVDFVRG